jgi:hypothetical protein
VLLRGRQGGERYRAEVARRRQAREKEIERSLADLDDRLALAERFDAILARRGLAPD